MAGRTIEVVSAVPFKYVRLIRVSLNCGGERHDVLLSEAQVAVGVTFSSGGDQGEVDYQYEVFAHTDSDPGPTSVASEWRKTDRTILVVDPRELIRPMVLRAVAVFDKDRYRAVFVDVKLDAAAGHAAEAFSWKLTVDQPEWVQWVLVPADSSSDLQCRLRYVTASGDLVERSWAPLDGTIIVAANPPDATG